MKYAAIDIGTNSVLCLIAETSSPPRLIALADFCEIPRLGEGLSREGALKNEAMERTLFVLKRYRDEIRTWSVPDENVLVIATAGMRKATNAADFIDRVRRELDLEIQVIDGEKEAYYSYLAVAHGFAGVFPAGSNLLIIDIGGGSTEAIRAGAGNVPSAVEFAKSLGLGSVWLTEKFLKASDPPSGAAYNEMEREIDRIIIESKIDFGKNPIVIGLAGTVTTLAAMSLQMRAYDAAKLQGSKLEASTIARLIQEVLPMPFASRKHFPGLQAERADVIVAGAAIALAILRHAGADALYVSDHGIRYGVIYDAMEPAL